MCVTICCCCWCHLTKHEDQLWLVDKKSRMAISRKRAWQVKTEAASHHDHHCGFLMCSVSFSNGNSRNEPMNQDGRAQTRAKVIIGATNNYTGNPERCRRLANRAARRRRGRGGKTCAIAEGPKNILLS